MILDGKRIAQDIECQLRERTASLKAKGVVPGLGILLVGHDGPSVVYVHIKERTALRLSFFFKKIELSAEATCQEVVSALDLLNRDERIHGIVVQVPLPPHLDLDHIAKNIDEKKDIDCLRSMHGLYAPPTAASITSLVESIGASLKGANVVVVGTGFFGRQIADYCAQQGARVKSVDSKTQDIASITRPCDILVSVAGCPECVTADWVSSDTIVIDVGVSKKNGSVVGDVNFVEVAPLVRAITPVPGGVGPLTVILLMKNVLDGAEKRDERS